MKKIATALTAVLTLALGIQVAQASSSTPQRIEKSLATNKFFFQRTSFVVVKPLPPVPPLATSALIIPSAAPAQPIENLLPPQPIISLETETASLESETVSLESETVSIESETVEVESETVHSESGTVEVESHTASMESHNGEGEGGSFLASPTHGSGSSHENHSSPSVNSPHQMMTGKTEEESRD